MRIINSDSFNKTLKDELDALRDLVSKTITPENIHNMPEELIRKVAVLTDMWGGDAIINSVPVSKLKAVIERLKTRQVETTSITSPVLEFKNGVSSLVVDIPDGFDGRNSFVQMWSIVSKKNPIQALQEYFEGEYGSAVDDRFKFSVQKNGSSIRLSCQDNAAKQNYISRIFLWRYR